jgi:hypothetical protein
MMMAIKWHVATPASMEVRWEQPASSPSIEAGPKIARWATVAGSPPHRENVAGATRAKMSPERQTHRKDPVETGPQNGSDRLGTHNGPRQIHPDNVTRTGGERGGKPQAGCRNGSCIPPQSVRVALDDDVRQVAFSVAGASRTSP